MHAGLGCVDFDLCVPTVSGVNRWFWTQMLFGHAIFKISDFRPPAIHNFMLITEITSAPFVDFTKS